MLPELGTSCEPLFTLEFGELTSSLEGRESPLNLSEFSEELGSTAHHSSGSFALEIPTRVHSDASLAFVFLAHLLCPSLRYGDFEVLDVTCYWNQDAILLDSNT